MKIALLGSRGIPARYSGFETFYEQLALRLTARGHDVTVYNRSHFIPDVKTDYKGVNIVSLPAIQSKHLETISFTFVSSIHALFQQYDIAYYCIVGNSPLAWIPRISGTKTLLNVDGEDWAREKWSGFARWYQKKCEHLAVKTAHVIISDAEGIQTRYRELYQAQTIFVPYGANIQQDSRLDVLEKWGLAPQEYMLYVGRFVPENAIDLLINAFNAVDTDKKLVIIGDAPYADEYKRYLQKIADRRVVFTGYAFGKDYAQLSSHALFYIQPSGINGTRPALLDQMGFGNCVLVRDTPVNMEVIRDCGMSFDRHAPLKSLAEKIETLIADPSLIDSFRRKARARIKTYYNWDWVTDFYENLFQRMRDQKPLISYDDFIRPR